MNIGREELEKLVLDVLNGLEQVSPSSSIKEVILEVNSLDEMINNGDVIGELAKRLDEELEYPVFVRERIGDGPIEGKYLVKLSNYQGGRFVSSDKSIK
ncbi:MAG: hypothetical protein ABH840_04050 [Nanoarchaeota archaeon]